MIQFIKSLLAKRAEKRAYEKAQQVRNIPNSYFKGYRRLAKSREDLGEQEKCWNCRNAVAYVTWHCELKGPCKWKECYVATELTKADLRAGQQLVGGWLGLPDDRS